MEPKYKDSLLELREELHRLIIEVGSGVGQRVDVIVALGKCIKAINEFLSRY